MNTPCIIVFIEQHNTGAHIMTNAIFTILAIIANVGASRAVDVVYGNTTEMPAGVPVELFAMAMAHTFGTDHQFPVVAEYNAYTAGGQPLDANDKHALAYTRVGFGCMGKMSRGDRARLVLTINAMLNRVACHVEANAYAA